MRGGFYGRYTLILVSKKSPLDHDFGEVAVVGGRLTSVVAIKLIYCDNELRLLSQFTFAIILTTKMVRFHHFKTC